MGVNAGLNAYSLGSDSPINFLDPWGLCGDESICEEYTEWFDYNVWWRVPKSWSQLRTDVWSGLSDAPYALGPLAMAPEIGMAGFNVFMRCGKEWHAGLEYGPKMNIVHIGNSIKYGVHVAIGAVAPYVADIHIYANRIWRAVRK
jgi:hypothetical protein